MAGDTVITVVGNLTADPELRFTPSGAAVASFTIASTPRQFDRKISSINASSSASRSAAGTGFVKPAAFTSTSTFAQRDLTSAAALASDPESVIEAVTPK